MINGAADTIKCTNKTFRNGYGVEIVFKCLQGFKNTQMSLLF